MIMKKALASLLLCCGAGSAFWVDFTRIDTGRSRALLAVVASPSGPTFMSMPTVGSQPSNTRITEQPAYISAVESAATTASGDFIWIDRALEIAGILGQHVICPLLETLITPGVPQDWNDFWSTTTSNNKTMADRFTYALEELGCTYVKFGQALASRPDIVPRTLADSLSKLQDSMEAFPTSQANDIIQSEVHFKSLAQEQAFLSSLSLVAAASIGQVYKGQLDNRTVAVKVQRPNIRSLIDRDAAMLRVLAKLPLVRTNLAGAVEEFMSRLYEELDYRNEARNIETFAQLYAHTVVVPNVYRRYCTDHVLVMEWIEGTKLTTVHDDNLDETMRMIATGVQCTLSQLLETGVMHADPHAANLIQVRTPAGTKLGYLDFGMISRVPETVRDGLVCAVSQLVFARNVNAVADLFGDLQLLPATVMDNPSRRLALTRALDDAFVQVLIFPADAAGTNTTSVPYVRFDKLLGSLAALVADFEFELPPYFLNNARALGTLEGIARTLDPTFNMLQVVYPFALNRLLTNPSGSRVVDDALQSLMREPRTHLPDTNRILQLLHDAAILSGRSRGRVLLDVFLTRKGRKVTREILVELLVARMRRRRVTKGCYFRL
jgi:aarF domain-containing kinase